MPSLPNISLTIHTKRLREAPDQFDFGGLQIFAVATAVKPWAKSRIACQTPRSGGVSPRVVRWCKSLITTCHSLRNWSTSLTPIT